MLANRATGPYSVIAQTKNDVTCRHMCTGVVHVFPVDRLSLFTVNENQAKCLALEDADQDVIEHIDGWRGDPAFRTSLEFFVKFRTNEDYIWLPWNDDVAESLPYEQYCNRYPCLRPLLMTTEKLGSYCLSRINYISSNFHPYRTNCISNSIILIYSNSNLWKQCNQISRRINF